MGPEFIMAAKSETGLFYRMDAKSPGVITCYYVNIISIII